jgi:hypothetical protein
MAPYVAVTEEERQQRHEPTQILRANNRNAKKAAYKALPPEAQKIIQDAKDDLSKKKKAAKAAGKTAGKTAGKAAEKGAKKGAKKVAAAAAAKAVDFPSTKTTEALPLIAGPADDDLQSEAIVAENVQDCNQKKRRQSKANASWEERLKTSSEYTLFDSISELMHCFGLQNLILPVDPYLATVLIHPDRPSPCLLNMDAKLRTQMLSYKNDNLDTNTAACLFANVFPCWVTFTKAPEFYMLTEERYDECDFFNIGLFACNRKNFLRAIPNWDDCVCFSQERYGDSFIFAMLAHVFLVVNRLRRNVVIDSSVAYTTLPVEIVKLLNQEMYTFLFDLVNAALVQMFSWEPTVYSAACSLLTITNENFVEIYQRNFMTLKDLIQKKLPLASAQAILLASAWSSQGVLQSLGQPVNLLPFDSLLSPLGSATIEPELLYSESNYFSEDDMDSEATLVSQHDMDSQATFAAFLAILPLP